MGCVGRSLVGESDDVSDYMEESASPEASGRTRFVVASRGGTDSFRWNAIVPFPTGETTDFS